MKMHVFKRFQASVESLACSTSVTLGNRHLRVTLGRRCSPFVSHREISFECGDGEVDGSAVYFANSRYRLAVCIGGLTEREEAWLCEESETSETVVKVERLVVPAILIWSLLQIATEYALFPSGERAESLVDVYLPMPVVEAWEIVDGLVRPVYKRLEPVQEARL